VVKTLLKFETKTIEQIKKQNHHQRYKTTTVTKKKKKKKNHKNSNKTQKTAITEAGKPDISSA